MFLLEKIQRIFLDMDGMIDQGIRRFPATHAFPDFLKTGKTGSPFLSGNASQSIPEQVENLRQSDPALPRLSRSEMDLNSQDISESRIRME